MIEINLQSEENKVKIKKETASSNAKRFLFILPLVFGVIILIHILLTVSILIRGAALKSLDNQIKQLEPEKKALEQAHKTDTAVSQDAKFLEQAALGRINYAKKLNNLSLDLSGGVWFEEVSFEKNAFYLKGSVVSLQKEEMGLINDFISRLKADTEFYKDFASLELSSAQKRTVAGYDITDFVLVGKLKAQ